MTSTKNVFNIMMRPKFKQISMWLLIEVAAIVIITLINGLQNGFASGTVMGIVVSIGMASMMVGFGILAFNHEKIYTQDAYRLIPVSDTKLYLMNLVTSFLTYLYISIVQTVLVAIASMIDWSFVQKNLAELSKIEIADHGTAGDLTLISVMAIFMLTLVILGWTTISLAHLIIRAIRNFLPNFSQKIVRTVLNIVMVVAVLYFLGWALGGISNLSDMIPEKHMIIQIITSVIGILIITVLESIGSVYLLHHWVETVA